MASATSPEAAATVKHRNVNGFVHYTQCGVGCVSRTSSAQSMTTTPTLATKASKSGVRGDMDSIAMLVVTVTSSIALVLALVFAAYRSPLGSL